MELSIYLPDDHVLAADSLAEQLGLSRSVLLATALAEFIARHRDAEITVRLDHVYGTESSDLEPGLEHVQRRTLCREEW